MFSRSGAVLLDLFITVTSCATRFSPSGIKLFTVLTSCPSAMRENSPSPAGNHDLDLASMRREKIIRANLRHQTHGITPMPLAGVA